MTRRALVIGAQTGGLSGVHRDVDTMSAILAERDFDVDRLIEGGATQEAIRDALERLIADVRADSAVVVYFSGNGGFSRVYAPSAIALPEQRFIVPTDYEQSSPGDFRGITTIEISVALSRLTDRARNVTMIIDCCYAGRMVRDGDLTVKAWPHPTYLEIAEHTGILRAQGLSLDLFHPISNLDAVRVSACAAWESAYEYTGPDGERCGVLTNSLRVALDEAGAARVTWSTLIQRVRDRVHTMLAGQRPEVEGPSDRLIFGLESGPSKLVLPVIPMRNGRVILPGAALLGIAAGDEFGITPAGAPAATETTMVATAVVTKTDGVTVEADFKLVAGRDAPPALMEAHPLTAAPLLHLVLVRGDGELAKRIRDEIDSQPTLQTIGPAELASNDPILAEVIVTDQISLLDGGPSPLSTSSADDDGISSMVLSLTRLGRTAALRRLRPRLGEALVDKYTVEWGRVENHVPHKLPPSGALLHIGDSVYMRLRNDSKQALYFYVFDIGVAHAVTLTADPGGAQVGPGEEYWVGRDHHGRLTGIQLTWPAGLPTDGPRPETLLVLVTTEPRDLSMLTHDGAVATGSRSSSPLRRALDSALGGALRDWAVRDQTEPRFAVSRAEFDLSPAPAPVPERPKFLIDERPHASARELRRGMSTPRRVAVRLTELIVHRNRSVGAGDVRIDTLVIAGGVNSLRPRYQARTAWFGRIRDGDRLPLEDMLIYQGPVVDYLDLAWWISRGRGHSQALTELLVDRLVNEAMRKDNDWTRLSAGAASRAEADACAVVINAAYEILTQSVGQTIGLYRTSLSAHEDFGVGRHPARGALSVQDFSIAFEIIDAT